MARPIKKSYKNPKHHDENRGRIRLFSILRLGVPYLIIMFIACLVKICAGLSAANDMGASKTAQFSPIYLIIIKLVFQYITVGYVIFRFKDYFEKRKNNNILGDNIFAWVSEPFIDKYHLREKILRGSRLKIKRDAKRHEIKYYWCAYILFLLYPVITNITNTSRAAIYSLLFLTMTVTFIFDKIEGRRLITKDVIIIIITSIIIEAIISIPEIMTETTGFKLFNIFGNNIIKPEYSLSMIPNNLFIPLAFVVVLFIYALLRKRWLTVFIMGCALMYCTVIFLFLSAAFDLYFPVYLCGYLYILLLIIQTIYNRKALKKITFIN